MTFLGLAPCRQLDNLSTKYPSTNLILSMKTSTAGQTEDFVCRDKPCSQRKTLEANNFENPVCVLISEQHDLRKECLHRPI